MAGQERHLAPFQCAEHVSVRGFAERGLHCNFTDICEAGHGIQTAAAHNADFSLLQERISLNGVIVDYSEIAFEHGWPAKSFILNTTILRLWQTNDYVGYPTNGPI